jgi:hypothetical protein
LKRSEDAEEKTRIGKRRSPEIWTAKKYENLYKSVHFWGAEARANGQELKAKGQEPKVNTQATKVPENGFHS